MCGKFVFLLTSFSLLLILSLTPLTATVLAEGTLEGKKILMVIAQQDFRDEELFKPREVFESAGASVFVAAPGHGAYHIFTFIIRNGRHAFNLLVKSRPRIPGISG